MTERSIIHIGGSPGGGKSRMGVALVDRLHESTSLNTEYISVGDQVRLLARSAINASLGEYIHRHLANPVTANDPLDEEIIHELVDTSLRSASSNDTDVVFLDGYPRYVGQVDSYFDLARAHGYATPGALITEVDMETALTRVAKRGRKQEGRSADALHAWDKVISHNESYPATLQKLGALGTGFIIHRINTSGPKLQTDDRALEATMQLIGEPLPKSA